MVKKIIKSIVLVVLIFNGLINSYAQVGENPVKDSTDQSKETVEPIKGITVPAGTKFTIIISTQLATNRNVEGSTFSATLNADLKVDTIIVSPKGSQVIGKIVESKSGKGIGESKLSIQVTEITINKKLTPVATEPIVVKGEHRRNAEAEISAGSVEEITLKQALKIN